MFSMVFKRAMPFSISDFENRKMIKYKADLM
jgi:hypothetical protein